MTAAIIGIVEVEGPVHIDDVAGRVAAMWGMRRVGRRIAAKVESAVWAAVENGGERSAIVQRDDFLWPRKLLENGASVPVRSRTGTKISGDRIAPEEIREAIRLVLQAVGGMMREELLSETRHLLGVGKTALAAGFDSALKEMVRDGMVGDGSTGFALRG